MIVAVDFDGTLCDADCWPQIHNINLIGIYVLKEFKDNGGRLILWTCRTGRELKDAVNACAQYDLYFDAVNENDPQQIRRWREVHGNTECSPKVYADLYIDDKAIIGDGKIPWREVHKLLNHNDMTEEAFFSWINLYYEKLGKKPGIVDKAKAFLGHEIKDITEYSLFDTPRRSFKRYCEDILEKERIPLL